MKELVFSVQTVFNNNSQEGCLTQYESNRYHIPAYQRGYKWGSEPDGAVSILLNDLWEAFETSRQQERKEYYLQYITVKKSYVEIDGWMEPCLEVIDGQQRLTTLSIFLSVLAALLKKDNISANKLHYAVRENFFSGHIYQPDDLEKLVGSTWEELIADKDLNKQDIFYLHAAACKAYGFFKEREAKLLDFYNYLLQYVKLIINSVEPHVESETVFKNLNSNKVLLTEAELIKGLLITKVGRQNTGNANKHFREVLEIRVNLGRHWDEINRWANQPEIRTFFFGGQEGMQQLLRLVALSLQKNSTHIPSLFNFYHSQSDLTQTYQQIQTIQATLNDWYHNDEIYNLMGFCRFVKGSEHNNLEFLNTCFTCTEKTALIELLEQTKEEILKFDVVIPELQYGEDNKEIHSVLLALSVFPQGLHLRFNFHTFITERWTLEHIFPQSPEGKDAILDQAQKEAIEDMLGDNLTNEISTLLAKDKRTEEEKQLYYRALQNTGRLGSIGNMCLLSGRDNSSNGCLFFREKRKNVLQLIQRGSFVPKHTFDVFSKMIPQLESTNLYAWSRKDIEWHTNYIVLAITTQPANV